MNDLRSTAIIVFADISMTILNFLFVGYLFVDLKKQEVVHAEVDRYKQKGIEVPKLENGGSGEPLSNDLNIEIAVPTAGQFIIDGKNYAKSDLDETLDNFKNKFSQNFNMKRSSRRWKKKRQMRWKWQRKRLRKEKRKRKLKRARSK